MLPVRTLAIMHESPFQSQKSFRITFSSIIATFTIEKSTSRITTSFSTFISLTIISILNKSSSAKEIIGNLFFRFSNLFSNHETNFFVLDRLLSEIMIIAQNQNRSKWPKFYFENFFGEFIDDGEQNLQRSVFHIFILKLQVR